MYSARVRLFLLGLLALVSPAALAQSTTNEDPISTVRPRLTDTTRIVPVGDLQLESGIDAGYGGPDYDLRDTYGEILLRYGLASRLELRLGLPSYTQWRNIPDFDGFGDLTLAVSYLLGRLGPARFALQPGLTLPTGPRYPHVANVAPSVALTAEAPLGSGVSVASTVGYGYVRYDYPFLTDRNRFDELHATFAFERALRGRASVFAEYAGTYVNGIAPRHAANFGARLRLSHASQVDVRLLVPIDDGNRQSSVGAGYSVRF